MFSKLIKFAVEDCQVHNYELAIASEWHLQQIIKISKKKKKLCQYGNFGYTLI